MHYAYNLQHSATSPFHLLLPIVPQYTSSFGMSKTITVFGATGVQGGSVVRAILGSPSLCQTYHIRAITRDPSKPSARKLTVQGVECVKADLNDSSSILAALKDSYAVFAVTNYWETASRAVDVQHGRRIADACKEAGVKHLIFSALPSAVKLSGGKLKGVQHFESKAEVAEYIESIKGKEMVATYFMPGFYMQNIKGMISLDQASGVPTLFQPWDREGTKVALLDAATDTGTYVVGILEQKLEDVNGKFVQACSDWVTPGEIVEVLSEETGQKIRFQTVSADDFRGLLPKAVADEMTENMLLVKDYSYFGTGAEKEQGEADEILAGAEKVSWRRFVKQNGPWEWKGGKGESKYDNL